MSIVDAASADGCREASDPVAKVIPRVPSRHRASAKGGELALDGAWSSLKKICAFTDGKFDPALSALQRDQDAFLSFRRDAPHENDACLDRSDCTGRYRPVGGCFQAAAAGNRPGSGAGPGAAGGGSQLQPPRPQPAVTAGPGTGRHRRLRSLPSRKPSRMRLRRSPRPTAPRTPRPWPGLFTDDVVLTDPEGNETRGKAAVAEMYAGAFQENPGLKLETQVAEVRFITPDVARVEGQITALRGSGDASEFTRFSSLLVRKDGKWQAAEIREFTAPAEDIAPARAAQRAGVDGRPLGRREWKQQGRVQCPLGRQQQLPDPHLHRPHPG